MNKIEILLTVIALIEAGRLWIVSRPITKKRHFTQMLKGTEKMIWELEFKVFKTLKVREEVREEYDQMNSRIATIETQIKDKATPNDKKEKLGDELTLAIRDRDRFKTQLEGLDLEVNGTKPTNEIPDGYTGLYSKIESFRELVGVIRNWIKQL